MNRRMGWVLSLVALAAVAAIADRCLQSSAAAATSQNAAAQEVELFDAARSGVIEEKFIAMSDRKGRLIITNKTKHPLNVKLPEAFAAVPVLAQFGGGGGGGNRGGGGGGTGGGQQSAGGGMGGGGGGGGGMFSIPPEKTAKINVDMVCLDHGLRDPSSSKPYKIVAAEDHVDKPEVIELLKGFGRGELQHGAAQAAAWHLNSEVSWNDLAAKQTGTERNINRSAYFSPEEIQTGIAYANEAVRRAKEAEEEKKAKEEAGEAAEEPATDLNSSELRSTTDE